MIKKIGDKEVLSTADTCYYTGLTVDILRGMREPNKGGTHEGPHYVLVGKSIYYLKSSVDHYLKDLGVKSC